MLDYVCSYCGQQRGSPDSSTCQMSPHSTKCHEWISTKGKKEFVCSYCGQQRFPDSSTCGSSPHSTRCHKWIAK